MSFLLGLVWKGLQALRRRDWGHCGHKLVRGYRLLFSNPDSHPKGHTHVQTHTHTHTHDRWPQQTDSERDVYRSGMDRAQLEAG